MTQTQPTRPAVDMADWIVRFGDLEGNGQPLMFIDSILPGHHRMNYAIVGDTASENDSYTPMLTQPHKFQLGMFRCPPGNGPAFHTHDYVETFFLMSGRWRFYWGTDPESPDAPDGERILDGWDVISFPAGLWRGFENAGDRDAWGFAVLETHEVFVDKDPYWPAHIVEQARAAGLEVDEAGKMIKPRDYDELEARAFARLAELSRP